MSGAILYGLRCIRGLDSQTLYEINQLVDFCNQFDRTELKVAPQMLEQRNPDQINDFLYYTDGKLVGFFALYEFYAGEAESSGVVHPEYRRRGIGLALLQAAKEECKRRNIQKLVVINHNISDEGRFFLEKLKATFLHSEYKMVLLEPMNLNASEDKVKLVHATVDDVPLLAQITAICFCVPEESILEMVDEQVSDPTHDFFVALVGEQIVGRVCAFYPPFQKGAFIYGLCTHPDFQNHGYGRDALRQIIKLLLEKQCDPIALEVSISKKKLLQMYESFGFQESKTYDYYQM